MAGDEPAIFVFRLGEVPKADGCGKFDDLYATP